MTIWFFFLIIFEWLYISVSHHVFHYHFTHCPLLFILFVSQSIQHPWPSMIALLNIFEWLLSNVTHRDCHYCFPHCPSHCALRVCSRLHVYANLFSPSLHAPLHMSLLWAPAFTFIASLIIYSVLIISFECQVFFLYMSILLLLLLLLLMLVLFVILSACSVLPHHCVLRVCSRLCVYA